jgi:aryl-alcohol dehydrogenase-like predicted oxidoreductase
MSLPVTAAVIGMPKLEYVEQNISIAKSFQPLPPDEMNRLAGELSATHKASIDRFFACHHDC